MVYNIMCKNYKQCVYTAEKFAKLYSEGKPKYVGTTPVVHTGEDIFRFFHMKSPGKEYISLDTFTKKYLTPKSQTV